MAVIRNRSHKEGTHTHTLTEALSRCRPSLHHLVEALACRGEQRQRHALLGEHLLGGSDDGLVLRPRALLRLPALHPCRGEQALELDHIQ